MRSANAYSVRAESVFASAPNVRVESPKGVGVMVYRKINLELVVFADEAESVIAELTSAIDRLEDKHTIFGGEIETQEVQHTGTRRQSALTHALGAGNKAAAAMRLAGSKVATAYKAVI